MENPLRPLVGLRILMVEDEVMVAMMLEDMLRDFGCSVELASGIENALASIRSHAPDGVLLDLNIQGQKTIAVAEELVSRSVPFLLVTGYSAGDGDPPVLKAAPRLLKPFTEEDLGRRMAEVFVPGRKTLRKLEPDRLPKGCMAGTYHPLKRRLTGCQTAALIKRLTWGFPAQLDV